MTYIWGPSCGSVPSSPQVQFEPCEVEVRPARIYYCGHVPMKPNLIKRIGFQAMRIPYLKDL